MATSIVIASVAPDKLAAWRRFQADLAGPRRAEWVQSQRRRGITREVVFVVPEPSVHAVYVVEGTEASAAMDAVEASSDSFDRWYWGRMLELHGEMVFAERVHDTRPGPGAWRGWRGWRGPPGGR